MIKKILVLSTLILLLPAVPVRAAMPATIDSKGIALTPAIENLSIDPSQPQKTFTIKVENRKSTAARLSISSLDFHSLNESGGLAFIGSNADQLQHKYGLADWLILPAGTVSLAAHSSKDIQVTIDNRADLAPGGHYAAVLFKDSGVQASGINRVDLNEVVSTLVFIKKSGGEIYRLDIKPPNLKWAWFGLPGSLGVEIKNSGNTQTYPRGLITVQGPDNKTYEKGVLNVNSGMVLPDSTRYYQTDLFKTASAWRPGTYTANVTYRPEESASAQTTEVNFFFINLPLLILLLIVLVLIILVYRRLNKTIRRKISHAPAKQKTS